MGGAAKHVLRSFQFSRRTLPSTQIGLFVVTNFVKPKNKREQNARRQRYHDPEIHSLNRSHPHPRITLANLTFALVARSACIVVPMWRLRLLPHQSTAFLTGSVDVDRRLLALRIGAETSTDLPVGQITRMPVQPHLQKYFAMPVGQIIFMTSRHPASIRGAYRDRHGRWVRDAVDAIASRAPMVVAGRVLMGS